MSKNEAPTGTDNTTPERAAAQAVWRRLKDVAPEVALSLRNASEVFGQLGGVVITIEGEEIYNSLPEGTPTDGWHVWHSDRFSQGIPDETPGDE